MKPLYNLKMRASAHGSHISGAERLVTSDSLPDMAQALTTRALQHDLGQADAIHVTMEAVDQNKVLTLQALPTQEVASKDCQEAFAAILFWLGKVGIRQGEHLKKLMTQMHGMRGAMLVDCATLTRVDDYGDRGVRVTCMDKIPTDLSAAKNHYAEALVLATKVAHCPEVLAELCISDDPAYDTGYVASSQFGYIRIGHIKEKGGPGGRIFFLKQGCDLKAIIEYFERTPIQVTGIEPRKGLKDKWDFLQTTLTARREANLLRSIEVCDDSLCVLSSNDYLGLTKDKRILLALTEAAAKYGSGSGGARLTTGTSPLHQTLEAELARFKNAEDCLLFNTGYMANLGVIQAIARPGSIILSDSLNHASIIDGCRLSKAKVIVYQHNDMQDLEAKAKAYAAQPGLMVSDAVFSMDGDILDLPRFLAIAKRYDFFSMIDEAHATGVLGQNGRGSHEYFGLSEGADITVGTLSKALASEGGFVTGSKLLCDYLRNTARSFIFSTALAPATIAAALQALHIVESTPQLISTLHQNMDFFCAELTRLGIPCQSASAILPIVIGSEQQALAVARSLRARHYLTQAIRWPTVAKNQARLRLTVRSDHTQETLQKAAQNIADCLAISPREL